MATMSRARNLGFQVAERVWLQFGEASHRQLELALAHALNQLEMNLHRATIEAAETRWQELLGNSSGLSHCSCRVA